ncbi:MAG: diguanylate cyclase, partial [Candidatus Aminicenantes bacterium]|nr:diguanylate cyclase [Candidatus Aminicenantes bacterium]
MTAEKQVSEVFEGATKSFCSTLLNQTQDGVYCLDRNRRIVLWNKGAETITGFERSEVLGKQCPEDVVLLVDPEGHSIDPEKCPIIAAFKDGTIHSAELYIQHKDGYRLPVFLRVVPVFKDDGEIIGTAEVFTDISPKVTIPLNVNELERMALIDTETGITNRKYLEMHLAARIDEFQKYSLPFGLIYADVDHYDKLLERYGRFNAAKVLRMIARTIHKNIRYFDMVGRWNTEEFLIIFLNIDETRLDIVSNKLRLLVAESYISAETGVLSATISMGACLVQRY